MTEREFDLSSAFVGLRTAVRETVRPPSPERLRGRAEQRLRTRRAGIVTLAAATVVGLLLVSYTAARPRGWAPAPGESPSVTSPAPSPTVALRPSLSVPPWPAPADDPIARVDWAEATIGVAAAPWAGCPSGVLRFHDGHTEGVPMMYQGLVGETVGDLDGDGSAEAVLEAGCTEAETVADPTVGLLVVTRESDGSLRALGPAGPYDWEIYATAWIDGGRLFAEQRKSVPGYDYQPGSVAAYRWNGGTFELVPPGLGSIFLAGEQGPAIDLGPDDGYVARALHCPGGAVRLAPQARLESWYEGGETVPGAPDALRVEHRGVVLRFDQPPSRWTVHTADLAGDGHRYVLATVLCHDPGLTRDQVLNEGRGVRGSGVLVLDRTPSGFRAVDVVTTPAELVSDWSFNQGTLTVSTFVTDPAVPAEQRFSSYDWTWNGQYFQDPRRQVSG